MTNKILHKQEGETVSSMQSFAGVLKKNGGVHIPVDIRGFLGVKPGDILEVGVRKITRDEALADYSFSRQSQGYHGIYYGDANLVMCPICSQQGRLSITLITNKYGRSYFQKLVAHDTGAGRIAHYITDDLVTSEIRVAVERMRIIREEFKRFNR